MSSIKRCDRCGKEIVTDYNKGYAVLFAQPVFGDPPAPPPIDLCGPCHQAVYDYAVGNAGKLVRIDPPALKKEPRVPRFPFLRWGCSE